jgi:hypothetical protein
MRTSQLLAGLGALPAVLSIPVQPAISNTTTLPVHFGILVFDSFQALDVFGPLDVISMSRLSQPKFSARHSSSTQ